MKIIDACPFFNEIELLKIRVELLYRHVDGFCICESNLTHAGEPKPYFFEARQAEFAPWIDKITYLKFQPDIRGLDFSFKDKCFNPESPAWQMERAQRNALAHHCNQFSEEDLFIVSDLDEIVNPDIVDALRSGDIKTDKARLEMYMHYYYLNCRGVGSGAENKFWRQGYVASVAVIKETPGGLSWLRVGEPMPTIQNGGWHFSYLGGIDRIREKIAAAAHTELNRPEINNLDHLRRCIELGIDHLNRQGHEYAFYPVDSYPPALANLMRKNPALVKSNLM